LARKYSSNPAVTVKYIPVNRGVFVIGHPPHSPDLAASGVFLFPKMKTPLKWSRFLNVEEMRNAAT
jgi:hypothetical protein